MKNKFIGFLIAGVICSSFISCPVAAEDRFTIPVKCENKENKTFEAIMNGEIQIKNDGCVVITLFGDLEEDIKFSIPKISIDDTSKFSYDNANYYFNKMRSYSIASYSVSSTGGGYGYYTAYNTNTFVLTFSPKNNRNSQTEKDGIISVNFGDTSFSKKFGTPNISVFGDIDGNGLINANDATLILRYSAYVGTGGTKAFSDFVKEN